MIAKISVLAHASGNSEAYYNVWKAMATSKEISVKRQLRNVFNPTWEEKIVYRAEPGWNGRAAETELAVAVLQRLGLLFLSRAQLSILPCVRLFSWHLWVRMREWGNLFSGISCKCQAVISQKIPGLLECINLKGGELSSAPAPFIQNAAEWSQLHTKRCLVFFFFP